MYHRFLQGFFLEERGGLGVAVDKAYATETLLVFYFSKKSSVSGILYKSLGLNLWRVDEKGGT